MTRNLKNVVAKVILTLGLVAVIGAGAGCDEWLDPYAYLGYVDYGYPSWGLYDPTDTIQSVVDYRQDVMDWSADAWCDYIRQ